MWSVTSERLCNARGAQHQPELLSSGAFNRQITLFIYLFIDLYIYRETTERIWRAGHLVLQVGEGDEDLSVPSVLVKIILFVIS